MWFRSSRKTRRSAPAKGRRSFYRPHIDALEDRCVPSTAGSLDPTFGAGAGYVTTGPVGHYWSQATLIQPNGDIIVGAAKNNSSTNALTLARYNPDGTLDATFGSGGIALAPFGSPTVLDLSAALYPQAGTANDGKIIEEGENVDTPDLLLARYNANGTVDTTFGTGGEVTTAIPGVSELTDFLPFGAGVVMTGNGQIVTLATDVFSSQIVLARYNSDGSLDTTFGQAGFVVKTIPGSDGDPGTSNLLQEPDGTLIVTDEQPSNGWEMYGFNANGTVDTSFGNQGVVTTAAPGGPWGAVEYLDSGTANDGKIVLVGSNGFLGTAGPLVLARYNANGSLDTTFGNGGLLQTQLNMGQMMQAALDPSGRIVVSGWNYSLNETSLARFNVNGTPDATFGNGGLVTATFGVQSRGYALAVYPEAGMSTDGDIVVMGLSSSDNSTYNLTVARFLGQATAPYFTITGPSGVTAGTANTYTINVYNPDGSADTGYSGTVQITSSDPHAVLPPNFTITGATATFRATLETAGTQSLTATDTVTTAINGSDASIQVNPAAATHFVISGPSSVKSGSGFSITVTALDAYGNVATGYTGTVRFTDSVGGGTLPGNYTFTAADAGVHTFSGLKLKTKGTQTLTVTDTGNGQIVAQLTITVS
jgi:uncharacterized delta-60 repeat protein